MRSLERMRRIYLDGFAGKRPATPISYADLESKAARYLSPEAFAYLAGGAGRETSIVQNRAALDAIRILPHVAGGAAEVDPGWTWRGLNLPAPVLFAPIGVLELAHPEGDLALARASRALGIPMIISSQASVPMEDIARALGDQPRLFQLYHSRSDELSRSFIRRAEAIDCRALVVTLDTTLLGWRPRDLGLGYSPFLHGRGIAQYWSDPVFNSLPAPDASASPAPALTPALLFHAWRLNRRIPKAAGRVGGLNAVRKFTSVFSHPGLDWSDIDRIRSWTKLPIYLKGILRPDDAARAVQAGVDGIIISNHGGRQIDGAVATAAALPAIAATVQGRIDIWIDSGMRTGSDVYKCLALGASAVCIGRPYAMALACNGTQGVLDTIHNLTAELELTMALSGCRRVQDIHASLIQHPWTNT